MKKPKRSTDLNQLAKSIVDRATAEHDGESDGVSASAEEKDPAAVSLGRRGGLKGGAARAKALTKKRRSEIATAAAKARWAKLKKK